MLVYHFVAALLATSPAAAAKKVTDLETRWGTDWPFSGITTFAHLPAEKCLVDPSIKFDIGIIGVPFDTAVSYRPGARFGPRAIRAASMRQTNLRGFNPRAGINPYKDWATVIDCMDMPITPVDNTLALHQMTEGFKELLGHKTVNAAQDGKVPRLVTLGGDHSIVLPHLRALNEIYGPIAVIHFDAHLDTWLPSKYPSGWDDAATAISDFTHGTMFWMAHEEGLLRENACIHAGLRTRLTGTDWSDYEDDAKQGFERISADDIDKVGVEGVIKAILCRVPANVPTYISVDIDTIDPGFAPGTGTPEVGGWSTRELIAMIRGLSSLNLVGADVVEVAPAYDHAEVTALAGAQIAYELLTNMVLHGREEPGLEYKNMLLHQDL